MLTISRYWNEGQTTCDVYRYTQRRRVFRSFLLSFVHTINYTNKRFLSLFSPKRRTSVRSEDIIIIEKVRYRRKTFLTVSSVDTEFTGKHTGSIKCTQQRVPPNNNKDYNNFIKKKI